jgi:hypothetical protein
MSVFVDYRLGLLIIAGIIISLPISIFHRKKSQWNSGFRLIYGAGSYLLGGVGILALFLRLVSVLIRAELSWLLAIPMTLIIALVCFACGYGIQKMLVRAKIL